MEQGLEVEMPRLQRVQSPVVPFNVVIVFFCLTVVADHAHLASDFLVIRGSRSSFPAGTQVLSGIKAECSSASDRSGIPPAFFFFGKILPAMPLASVFDHNKL